MFAMQVYAMIDVWWMECSCSIFCWFLFFASQMQLWCKCNVLIFWITWNDMNDMNWWTPCNGRLLLLCLFLWNVNINMMQMWCFDDNEMMHIMEWWMTWDAFSFSLLCNANINMMKCNVFVLFLLCCLSLLFCSFYEMKVFIWCECNALVFD